MKHVASNPQIILNGRFVTQEITGVQRFARGVARELIKMRDDVVVAVPGGSTIDESALPGAQYVEVGKRGGHFWEQVELPRFLKSNGRPLVVSLTSTGPAFYRNQVSTQHDVTYIHHAASFSRQFRLAYRVIVPPLLRNSRRIVTVSEFSAREVAEHYKVSQNKFFVVPNATDAIFSPAGPKPESDPYLLAVSSPNAHKNFGRLIEAFDRLPRDLPIKLRIIGGQNRSFSQQSFQHNTDRVEFLGRIDDLELAAQYRGATAFVFPSLYEGFGIPPLEAQASGTAVISSNAASMPEVLGESAYFFDPLNVDELESAIGTVVRDDELRASLEQRGLEKAARYSWERSASILSAELDQLVS